MSKKRDSYIYYRSFYEATKDLPDETRLKIYDAISEFSLNNKNPKNFKKIEKAIFILIKPQLSANRKRFNNGCKRKISKTEANHKQTVSKTEANHKQTVSKTEANLNLNLNDNLNLNHNQNVNLNKNDNYNLNENKKSLHTLPNNFTLTNRTRKKLNEEGYKKDQINKTLLSFIDYWIEGDGKGKSKSSWQTPFKIWIREKRPWTNKDKKDIPL